MTIEQTVEVPADHRLTIDVPREVPAGPVILAYRPAAHIKRRPISQYFGIVSPSSYGDGVAYQQAIRDEWDD